MKTTNLSNIPLLHSINHYQAFKEYLNLSHSNIIQRDFGILDTPGRVTHDQNTNGAKLRALWVHVPKVSCVLTCSRAIVSWVLICSCANVLWVLTRSRVNVLCMFTCSRANMSCILVLTWQRTLRAYVLTCLCGVSYSRANVLFEPRCSRASVPCVRLAN